jgi:hypothetical protein
MSQGHCFQRVAVSRKRLIKEMLEKEEEVMMIMLFIPAPFWKQPLWRQQEAFLVPLGELMGRKEGLSREIGGRMCI